jgi:hypothetical protein
VNAQAAPRATPQWNAEPASAPPPLRVDHAALRNGWSALLSGLRRGFHPPLLAAWTLLLWLPTAVAALPALLWLYLQTAHSPQAALLAADATFLARALDGLRGEAPFLAAGLALSVLLALLLSPWLNGMVLAQVRSGQRLPLRALLRAGLGEYPRMLRMLAWSLLLMGTAAAIGVAVMLAIAWAVSRLAPPNEDLVAPGIGWFLPCLLVLLAHASIEAGRGWLGSDPTLRSVIAAWRRGLAMLLQRPGATLMVYLGTSLVGSGLALACLRLRTLVDGEGWINTLLAFACVQCAVAALAWGRAARVHGLADVAIAHATAPPAAVRQRPRRSQPLR